MALAYPVLEKYILFLTAQLLDIYTMKILGLGRMPAPWKNGT
jgi:hypothetical protein